MQSVSNENMIQIPVRMGSNCFTVDVDQARKLTGYELIEMALNKCRVNGQLVKTYYIYERVNGVEQMLSRKMKLIKLPANAEIVVRKMSSMEKCAVAKRANNQSVARKYFKKLNKLNELNERKLRESQQAVNIYETIEMDETDDEKAKYLKRIIQNEIKLQKQTIKLNEIDQSINKREDDNTREKETTSKMCKYHKSQIVKSLLSKLKSSKLNTVNSASRTQLLNSCANSSDDEYDRKTDSRTSSTSTLESLV